MSGRDYNPWDGAIQLCLPLFLPMILYGQRLIGLRRHDGYPRWWEILQHWAIFSVLFEVILPMTQRAFAHTQDPWNVVAYLRVGFLREFIGSGGKRFSPSCPFSPACIHAELNGQLGKLRAR